MVTMLSLTSRPRSPPPGRRSHSSVVGRRADGSYYYTHGAYLGHMVPGTFFIVSRSSTSPPPRQLPPSAHCCPLSS